MPVTETAFITAHQRAQMELSQLQGAWNSIAGQRQAELLVAGNLFSMKVHDGAIYTGSSDIDSDENPRAMDMRIDEGAIVHKGRIALCIYELAGDTLRWCPVQPGDDQRPTAFCGDEAGAGLCLVLRREFPRWRDE